MKKTLICFTLFLLAMQGCSNTRPSAPASQIPPGANTFLGPWDLVVCQRQVDTTWIAGECEANPTKRVVLTENAIVSSNEPTMPVSGYEKTLNGVKIILTNGKSFTLDVLDKDNFALRTKRGRTIYRRADSQGLSGVNKSDRVVENTPNNSQYRPKEDVVFASVKQIMKDYVTNGEAGVTSTLRACYQSLGKGVFSPKLDECVSQDIAYSNVSESFYKNNEVGKKLKQPEFLLKETMRSRLFSAARNAGMNPQESEGYLREIAPMAHSATNPSLELAYKSLNPSPVSQATNTATPKPIQMRNATAKEKSHIKKLLQTKDVSDYIVGDADFNGDGVDDMVVVLQSSMYCGSGGCGTTLILNGRVPKIYATNGTFLADTMQFGVGEKTVNGVKTLVTMNNGKVVLGDKKGTPLYNKPLEYEFTPKGN